MNAKLTSSSDPGDLLKSRLSALADGEASQAELLAVSEAWRNDGQARAQWHAYSLIGDVMRSDDLAQSAARDAAFLNRLRARLADEPVVLAPPLIAPTVPAPPVDPRGIRVAGVRGLRRWGAPAAMAAGVLSVAGVTLMMRPGGPQPSPALTLAAVAASSAPAAPLSVARQDAMPAPAGALVRDPGLDRYLEAHRLYARGPALATPGGLRQVAATPADR